MRVGALGRGAGDARLGRRRRFTAVIGDDGADMAAVVVAAVVARLAAFVARADGRRPRLERRRGLVLGARVVRRLRRQFARVPLQLTAPIFQFKVNDCRRRFQLSKTGSNVFYDAHLFLVALEQ